MQNKMEEACHHAVVQHACVDVPVKRANFGSKRRRSDPEKCFETTLFEPNIEIIAFVSTDNSVTTSLIQLASSSQGKMYVSMLVSLG